MMLGSSICFVIVLAVIDIVNYIGGHIGKMNYRSLIDKPSQVSLSKIYVKLYRFWP